jgi:hypothetical protein
MANPLLIPPGYAQCVFIATNTAKNRRNTFVLGALLGSDETTLATNLAVWFDSVAAGGFMNSADDDWTTSGVEVIGHSVSALKGGGTVGSSGGAFCPPNAAVKIHKFAGARGKANKGYMYWFAHLPNNLVDDQGAIDPGWITTLNAKTVALLAAMNTDGSIPHILHHQNSSVTAPTPVVRLDVIPTVRTQRRRLTPRP